MGSTSTSSAISRAPATLPSSLLRSSVFRRRFPIVGAICVLSTLSLSSFAPSLSFPFKTSRAQSLSSAPILRSKEQYRDIHSTGMEAASTTVPSIVVYVTVPNKEADMPALIYDFINFVGDIWSVLLIAMSELFRGKKLAESIVKERLAACVNRVPGIESIYEWKGEIQTDSEELLIIKTRESLLGALTEHVKANHEYEVPEVIAMPIMGGNAQYLEWLKNSTRD